MVPLSREVMYVEEFDKSFPFFLAADIGGTNSNFGVFSLIPGRPLLVLSLHYKSKDVEDFTSFIKAVVEYIKAQYTLEIKHICIGAAGIVYPHRVTVKPTNLEFEINTHLITKATGIAHVVLINDFEAVALGIELINPHGIIPLNTQGVHRKKANKGFLGAGTGLGKSILVWHSDEKRYFPVPSEGGHADAVFHGSDEYLLARFMEDRAHSPISWEMVLSGAGIQQMYKFLGTVRDYPVTESTKEIEAHDFNPDRISFYAERDQRCKDTFDMYIRFYARCAKNFALDTLTLNGLYIAGGIAAKNISMFFDPAFLEEFVKCRKQAHELALIPISLIADYNVSLYGAVVAAKLRNEGGL